MPPTDRPPLVKELIHLREEGKRLINGPHAYRSKSFAQWHKRALLFFQSSERFDIGEDLEAEFQRRRFGKTLSLLNENELRDRFKQDMNTTIRDLDEMLASFERMGELKQPSLKLRGKLFLSADNKRRRGWLIFTVFLAVILIGALVAWALLT